jgi:hypothetical protein
MIKELVVFMKGQGFERMDDYHDNSCCPAHYEGDIFQFFNPETRDGVQFCIGPVDDNANMFSDDFIDEANEKFYRYICTFRDESGEGSTIHLCYRGKDSFVKEIKKFDNGRVSTFEFALGDFNQESYGQYGEKFLRAIGENPDEY